MDLFEAIERRHSYRKGFTGDKIPREDLKKVVQSGIKAPSGKNVQATKFAIVDDENLVSKISSMNTRNKAFNEAKAYIVCIIDKNPEPVFGNISFQVEDCAAAVENMLLSITALGYASVWIDGWLRTEGRAEKVAELLNLPEDKKVRVILPIGVPEEKISRAPKLSFEERAWFNEYSLQ